MSKSVKLELKKGGVKYPNAEMAYAVICSDKVPFSTAVIGVTEPIPSYFIEVPKRVKVTVLEYVVSGAGEILLGGRWQRAEGGDFYILAEGEEHRYRSDPEKPWKKLWINYSAAYMPTFLAAYGVKSGIYRSPEVKEIFEGMWKLVSSLASESDVAYIISDSVNRIVSIASAEIKREGADEYDIRRVISSYVNGVMSLDEIAAELHMSKSNLIRIFKKNYGTTPYEYLLSLKIDTAKALLRDTGISIKKIAERLCISDEHYFSTLFEKRCGMRPSAYRAKYR